MDAAVVMADSAAGETFAAYVEVRVVLAPDRAIYP